MTSKKISERLAAEALDCGESVDAVVELTAQSPPAADLPRAERISEMRRAFEHLASGVEDVVNRAGGKVVEKAWINQTLFVRLPATAIDAVAELKEVAHLDAPRRLKPEA